MSLEESASLVNQKWFSPENTTSLEQVPAGGCIHIIGICGIAMAQLALSLSQVGYTVSGSDLHFYDPMGRLLKESNITLYDSYCEDNVPSKADLVVIANAMFSDNPEVTATRKKNLPYSTFPMVMGEWLIGDRHSIVICGTHGKTTTTGITASVLQRLGKEPSWFIGGLSGSLPETLHKGTGDFSVFEGDEYHTCFFARKPKFFFYRPNTVVINAIEFDHGDIYKDLEAIVSEFRELLLSLSEGDRAICCVDYPAVRNLLNELNGTLACSVITFGNQGYDADYEILSRSIRGSSQQISLVTPYDDTPVEVTIPLIGAYNALNACASVVALLENGFHIDEIVRELSTVSGVDRRQQILFENSDYVLIEDFAHHPTAVRGTVEAVSESYPERRLIAVFEPRSNTSRRKIFEEDYKSGFSGASLVIISDVTSNSRMNDDTELINVTELAQGISSRGIQALALSSPEDIFSYLTSEVRPGDVVLIMSNGAFGNLCRKMKTYLSSL